MSERSHPQWRRAFGVEMPAVDPPPLPVDAPQGVQPVSILVRTGISGEPETVRIPR